MEKRCECGELLERRKTPQGEIWCCPKCTHAYSDYDNYMREEPPTAEELLKKNPKEMTKDEKHMLTMMALL